MTKDLFTRLASRAIALQVEDRHATAREDAETFAFDRRTEATSVEGEALGPPVSEPAFPPPPRYRSESVVYPPVAPMVSTASAGHPAPEEPTRQGQSVMIPPYPADTPLPAPRPGRTVPDPGTVHDPGRHRLPSGEQVPVPTLRARRTDVVPRRSEHASSRPALRPPPGPDLAANPPRVRSVPEATAPIPADITIGRLEIRVRPPSGTASKGAAERYSPSSQAVSLADYLRQREGGAK